MLDLRLRLGLTADSDFSLRNLPYGVFRPRSGGAARIGAAVGRFVLDLAALETAGLLGRLPGASRSVFAQPALNDFMALGRPTWEETHRTLLRLLEDERSPLWAPEKQPAGIMWRTIDEVEMLLPATIGDYTDFYASREHARNVGLMFRGPDQALLPNWLHLPVAYHGRAGSISLGGPISRPLGQFLPPGADAPVFGPTRELDFELEIGFFVGPGNEPGRPIPIDRAADHIFGIVLVNDWSARDIQRWEYRPLGPFLSKNFATSISPWVVPLLALEPFRCPGPQQEPTPLPYLQAAGDWSFDIRLEARLQSAAMAAQGRPPETICRTNFRTLYWNMAQQLAHHTVNGCNLRPGDLIASGTISGPEPDSYGSLLELAWRGERPLALPTGERRAFLEDGDRLTLIGWCQGDGYRIGLGELSGHVLPAAAVPANESP